MNSIFIRLFFISSLLFIYCICFSQTDSLVKPIKVFRFEKNDKDLPAFFNNMQKMQRYNISWAENRNGNKAGALLFNGTFEGLPTTLNISPSKYPQLTITTWIFDEADGVLAGTDYEYKTKYTLNPKPEDEKFIARNLYFEKGRGAQCSFQYIDKKTSKTYTTTVWSAPLRKNQWNFIAAVFNATDSSVRLYVNNEYYERKELKAFFKNVTAHLVLAKGANALFSRNFKGKVEEVAVYNQALTASQISHLSGMNVADVQHRLDKENTRNLIISNAVVVFFLLIIIYMIITMIVERFNKFKTVTIESVATRKNKSGYVYEDETMNNELALKYVEDAFLQWTVVGNDDQGELRSPTKRKQLKNSLQAFKKALALYPTDIKVIDRINDLGTYCNTISVRRFYGKLGFFFLSLIVPLIMFFISSHGMYNKTGVFVIFSLPSVAYLLASYAPTYLVAGRTSSIYSMFGGLLGVLFGAAGTIAATEQLVKVTNLRTGSSHVEHDTASEVANTGIGLIILIAGILLASIFTAIISIISFFRNYVLYI